MELKGYIQQLGLYLDVHDMFIEEASTEVVEEYIDAIQAVSPVKTGQLRDDWHIENSTSSGGVCEITVITNPVNNGFNYAKKVEKFYDSEVRAGNRRAFRFRKLTEATWRIKFGEELQKRIEKRLRRVI